MEDKRKMVMMARMTKPKRHKIAKKVKVTEKEIEAVKLTKEHFVKEKSKELKHTRYVADDGKYGWTWK